MNDLVRWIQEATRTADKYGIGNLKYCDASVITNEKLIELQAKAAKWDTFEASVRATGTKTSENVYLVPTQLAHAAIDDNEPESDWGGDEYCEPAGIKSEMALQLEAEYRKLYTPADLNTPPSWLCGINDRLVHVGECKPMGPIRISRNPPPESVPDPHEYARSVDLMLAKGKPLDGLSARYSADDLTKPDKYRGEPITCDLSED